MEAQQLIKRAQQRMDEIINKMIHAENNKVIVLNEIGLYVVQNDHTTRQNPELMFKSCDSYKEALTNYNKTITREKILLEKQ
ncbi:MAG: hypothetical protein KGY70_11545 [Bacteroidales bacterium]|nr:hypothetical protein [Bacteroidales bacterium]